jgi:hypothetical protein
LLIPSFEQSSFWALRVAPPASMPSAKLTDKGERAASHGLLSWSAHIKSHPKTKADLERELFISVMSATCAGVWRFQVCCNRGRQENIVHKRSADLEMMGGKVWADFWQHLMVCSMWQKVPETVRPDSAATRRLFGFLSTKLPSYLFSCPRSHPFCRLSHRPSRIRKVCSCDYEFPLTHAVACIAEGLDSIARETFD